MMNKIVLGVDIGGSHITVGAVNMMERVVLKDSIIREHVNCHDTAENIFNTWANAINKVKDNYNNITQIGFAMPGPFDYENGICLIKGFDKYESLYGLNVRNILAEELGLLPDNILFRNDAEAFLEGEMFCGAARDFNSAIGITLGTGLGSAISKNGITNDAELSVMDYEGEKIEEFVSTRGLIRAYKNLTGIKLQDAKDIAENYYKDENARKAFEHFSNKLSWFLERFIAQENAEVLVIGGNITLAWNFFMDNVIDHLKKHKIKLPVIVKAELGEDAGLIGGACCFNKADKQLHATI